jgi:NAD(P)-dependent dehydrogenase (short-subunit alcohol dehydrogenase family)
VKDRCSWTHGTPKTTFGFTDDDDFVAARLDDPLGGEHHGPMPVTLVTGTSTGIGFATALHFARKGHDVVATMRNLAKAGPLEAAAREEKLPLVVRELDVTKADSIERAVAAAVEGHGAIDVLVNNAGVAGAAPLEITPDDEHRAMFEANYWGPIRMIRAVLPAMRERRKGCIVNVTSIAGRLATPNQIAYSASKHALEAASEALAHEVAAFGIRVAVIEPGVIMTAIFENAASATHFDKTSPYRQIMRRNGKIFAAGFRNPGKSETVAEVIFDAVTTDRPRLRYLVGMDAEGLATGRARISDEQWVAMGGELADAEYNARFKEYFGIELP